MAVKAGQMQPGDRVGGAPLLPKALLANACAKGYYSTVNRFRFNADPPSFHEVLPYTNSVPGTDLGGLASRTYRLARPRPKMSRTTNTIRKRINSIFAIPYEAPAMPVNPNNPEMIEMMRKTMAQYSMVIPLS